MLNSKYLPESRSCQNQIHPPFEYFHLVAAYLTVLLPDMLAKQFMVSPLDIQSDFCWLVEADFDQGPCNLLFLFVLTQDVIFFIFHDSSVMNASQMFLQYKLQKKLCHKICDGKSVCYQ